ncbi:SMC-Scp complex subunit ScpB [Micrococcoides hystricis]|uniref:SMC-Scp complex subunit ScpB n=1 Tax=Micrococcoides hystricis TaxID=1572761 RepID=A0ABV6P6U1_9MICC
MSESTNLPRLLEAIMMVTDEPLSDADLAEVLGHPREDIESALKQLAHEFASAHDGQGRGFVLRKTGAGWRIYSHPDFAADIATFLTHGQSARLSQAALETLAVVAYRQPISRSQIAAIRGVSVDSVVKTLQSRGLVEEYGQDEHTQATLYQTTSSFLETMGITSLSELPQLSEHLPGVETLAEVLDTEQNPDVF